MKKMFWILPLFLIGCPPPTPKPSPHQPTDTSSCAAACSKLQTLKQDNGAVGCEEGKPLEDGTTCEKFCTDTQSSGHALRPSCIMEKVQKCSDIQPLCFEK